MKRNQFPRVFVRSRSDTGDFQPGIRIRALRGRVLFWGGGSNMLGQKTDPFFARGRTRRPRPGAGRRLRLLRVRRGRRASAGCAAVARAAAVPSRSRTRPTARGQDRRTACARRTAATRATPRRRTEVAEAVAAAALKAATVAAPASKAATVALPSGMGMLSTSRRFPEGLMLRSDRSLGRGGRLRRAGRRR